MANRMFYQFRYSLERDVVDLYARVSIGASGAPTLARGKGISSIVRNSAGNYTITLSDSYNALLALQVQQLMASGALDAPIMKIVSQSMTSKTIVVQFYAIDNSTATDPDDGAVLYIHAALSNAST